MGSTMQLKEYQTDTLNTLRRFFEQARIAGPKAAYETITAEPEQAARIGRYAGAYVPLDKLPDVPYVCLRLPTGGGKTLLAAHSIAIARDTWVEKDYPLVVWLVPTDKIRQQTAEALKQPRHAYRQTLNDAFDGRVRVFDIADFTHIRPHDLRDHCCIVVGTIQTLRVTNTSGRKVYAHNENLEPHFSGVRDTAQGLEKSASGGVKFSFANMLHLHRPLMIVDEAHNAVTGLTRDMQARLNPSAIIEFTATPKPKSNILHSISAQELKQAEMIKLPIMLTEHTSWQNAVNGAIAARASLDKTARDDSDYIRPIVLFQAQPKNEEVTVNVLKKHLLEVENVPETAIAVATGDMRELDGIDLFDPHCPIEYVITIEALKEGWDCSFAYVFCSVSRIQSAVDVEQILGRVLRMPYAKRRKAAELNRAYAFLSEPETGIAARSLVDKLVAMGFEEDEALDNVEPAHSELDDDGLFSPDEFQQPTFRHILTATPEVAAALDKIQVAGLTVSSTEGSTFEIAIAGRTSDTLAQAYKQLSPTEREVLADVFAQHQLESKLRRSPAERGETFKVPRLMTEIQGKLEFADTDVFMEFHNWSLLNHPARLDEHEFTIRETAHGFEIDLDGNRLTYRFAGEQEQLSLNVDVEGWTQETLVLWLDKQVRQPDVGQAELVKWLSGLATHLINTRGLHVTALMRCKFILARKIRDKIDAIRRQERNSAYQARLFAAEVKPEVSFETAFVFRDDIYQGERRHRGHWQPNKHFLGPHAVPAFDGAEDGEEVQCAQTLDSLPQVKFWVRNVARHRDSFWLPTATDKFYPDFVAQLEDDRLLVVEYKGARDADSSDTAEKRTIGELWQRASHGKGVFVIVERSVNGRDVRQQLLDVIGNQGNPPFNS
ncbi:MAG: DEAD/DEAH box helicase family protein [Nitrospira sp.]|nr:DEAD/DEAH box helicase family protein [Nitrospira sp.]